MYIYQVDENEINEKLKNNNISGIEDLEAAYKNIEKQNGFDFGEIGGYKKEEKTFDYKDVPEVNSEKIENEAQNYYKAEMDKKLEALENNYNNKTDNLDKKRLEALESSAKNEEKINNNYLNNAKNSLHNSVNQGIARSSIEEGKQKAVKSVRDNQLNDLSLETNKKLSEIENSLNILNNEKEKALNDFNISYALKIKEKIANLESQYKKQQEEAIKYNEKIAEEERKFNEQQEKKAIEYDNEVKRKMEEHEKNIAENGIFNVYGKEVLDEKFDVSLNYLNTLSKQDAINFIQNNNKFLTEQLGASRAYSLYSNMRLRKD